MPIISFLPNFLMTDSPIPTRVRQGLRDTILLSVTHLVEKHTKKVIFFNLFLTLLAVIYTVGNLKFKTGRSQLISQELKYNQDFKKLRDEFGDYDGLIVAARGNNPDRLKQYMETIGAELKADHAHFMDVFYKIDTSYFKDKVFLFLKEKELVDLFAKLRDNEEMINQLNEEQGLVNLFRLIGFKISKAMVGHLISGLLESGEAKEEKKEPVDLSLMSNILEQMDRWLAGDKSFQSPWASFFDKKGGASKEDGYISSPDQTIYMMTVNPVEESKSFSQAKKSIEIIREKIAELQKDFPQVDAGVTGVAALESDEMIATQADTIRASMIALVGVTLLFVFAFRGVLKPILAMVALVSSVAWTLGWTTLVIGHLNVISVVFITILIGLGIDFGIHLIMRYDEERKTNGFSVEQSLEKAILGAGKGILVGGITTALAFFTLAFADFIGIVEFGIIAGSGVLLSMFAMLSFLPAMLLIVERKEIGTKLPNIQNRPDVTLHISFLQMLLGFPKSILLIGWIGAACSFYWISVLKLDYNILNLQNEATESVQYEMAIIDKADRSTWYGAMVADTMDKARQLEKELKKLPTVGSVESILSVFPEDQENKIRFVLKEKKSLSGFEPPSDEITDDVNIRRLLKTLKKINFKLRENEESWSPGTKPEEGSIRRAKILIGKVQEKLERLGEKTEAPLMEYQERLFLDYQDKFSSLAKSLNPSPVELDSIPKPIKDRFVGKTGKYLLQVFPKENIWDREPMERFLTELRSLDPDVSGLAVQASESARLMKEGYVQGGVYALLTIVMITFFSFKNLKTGLLAMSPLFMGFLWLIALMELFDLQFNLANLVILPLIIGIGVDNGIHIVARYQEDGIDDPVSAIFLSTGKAVILSSLTTMIGFGSLMVANHYGIFSIGLLLTLGVGSCLLASTTILPLLLRLSDNQKLDARDTGV